jgi:hypothetical protein
VIMTFSSQDENLEKLQELRQEWEFSQLNQFFAGITILNWDRDIYLGLISEIWDLCTCILINV